MRSLCHARVTGPFCRRFANETAYRFIWNARRPCFAAWRNTDIPIERRRARVPRAPLGIAAHAGRQ
ncbi:hypothetical protein BFR06_24500 [Burkholderia pseudomallei]|nr:hypothetical protein ACT79_00465 [Burkholderia pseudomallei]APF94984.1 hypothetical protein BFR05_24480 [Burkholderia pseudomallei]APG01030.1 hypothetical protein BFR06_24500 [Burkholderia pseudomallei]ARK44600.1 hypothetical protein BOC60_31345 [Burkholderia pseudomallei]